MCFFSNGLWKSRGREDGYAYDTRMAVAGSYLEGLQKPIKTGTVNFQEWGKEVHDDALFSGAE